MNRIKILAGEYLIYFVLLFSGILRIWKLDSRDFWYDEAFSGVAVKEKFFDMMDMIIKDVHPPLYYVTLKFFSFFFDYSVFGIRLYSAIFGMLSVWAVYLVAKYLFGRRAGLWSAAIMAVSPFAIQYSQEARMYSMFGFLFLIASLFFFKGLLTKKNSYYIWWGFFLGLASLTHYMGIITFPIFFVIFCGWKIFDKKMLEGNFRWSDFKNFIPTKQLIFGYVVFAMVFSFWIPIFYRQLFKVGTLIWIKPATLGDLFVNMQIFMLGSPLGEMTGGSTGVPVPSAIRSIEANSIPIFLAVILTAITVYLFKKDKSKEKIAAVLILSIGYLFLVYILSLLGGHYLISRYLTPSAYFLYILFGVWLARIKFSFAASFFVIYALLITMAVPVTNSTGWGMLRMNINNFKEKDFYVLNPFDYVIARYYLGQERIILYNLDSPNYVADNWAAIGTKARSTKSFEDMQKNKRGIILSNTIINDQVVGKGGMLERKELKTESLKCLDSYENISLYSFN